ncbi:NUDIX hydrolase [Nocardia araoensis]|uniref:NUDIX hydrolase n=1 Tax=Nocardia araoensis TaxID=228600 RepID=UPI000584D150|nr:NUDIX domain-containing protein [Nocardia araoensis]
MTEDRRCIAALTADLVILTIREAALQVLVVERGTDPYRGEFALPGGFLRKGESAEAAAVRELREETGLDGESLPLEQVGFYTDPDRDPRERVVTCAFLAVAPDLPALPAPEQGSDAKSAAWKPVAGLLGDDASLAFDHVAILRDAVRQARTKLQYTTIATSFCPKEFTIGELREVYEAVWGVELDRANFHRKVKSATEFIVETGRLREGSGGRLGRPAKLYRAGGGDELVNPILLRLHRRSGPDRR